MNLILISVMSTVLTAATQIGFPFSPVSVNGKTSWADGSPRILDAWEREFHTELRRAITKGYDVVDGGTEHERRGPNFAGHYILVQWGCGSNCMEAALIDGDTGQILRLPQIPGGEEEGFFIPTASVDFRTLQFRTGSRSLGIPNIGDSHTYYYVLERGRWRFLKKSPTVDQ